MAQIKICIGTKLGRLHNAFLYQVFYEAQINKVNFLDVEMLIEQIRFFRVNYIGTPVL